MANHKSAKKRILRNEKKRLENHSRMSAIRTFVKRALEIVSGKKDGDAKAALADANSRLARGVKNGVVKKNRMARVMSKLAQKAGSAPKPAAKAAGANAEGAAKAASGAASSAE
jgi:small subunit ribosomal protein S20